MASGAGDLKRVKDWIQTGSLLTPYGSHSVVDLARAVGILSGMSEALLREQFGECDLTRPTELANEIGPGSQLVLLVLDGLGMNALEEHLPPDSFMRRHLRRELRAAFPATTAASLTAITTGQHPGQHGLLGWTVATKRHLINPLPLMVESTRVPIIDVGLRAEDIFSNVRPLFGRFPRVCKRALSPYADSPYTRANMDIPQMQCNAPQEALDQLAAFWLEARRAEQSSFAYLYCPEPDTTEHAVGIGHEEVGALLQRLDGELSRFWEKTKRVKGRKLVITADHGHRVVDVDRGEQLLLGGGGASSDDDAALLKLLKHPPSVEPRSPCFHVIDREGAKEEFAELFRRSRFSESFALLSAEQVEELGFLGPAPLSPIARAHLGDFMAITAGPQVIVHGRYSTMVGWHGGMTPSEVLVPLIVAGDGILGSSTSSCETANGADVNQQLLNGRSIGGSGGS